MNKRTLIIMALLALPLVVLAVLSRGNKPEPAAPVMPGMKPAAVAAGNAPQVAGQPAVSPQSHPNLQGKRFNRPPKPPTLEQQRNRVRNRLVQLEAMTPKQWDEETARFHGRVPPQRPKSLDEARKRNRDKYAELQKMTPEQWAEELKKPKPAPDNKPAAAAQPAAQVPQPPAAAPAPQAPAKPAAPAAAKPQPAAPAAAKPKP